MLTPTHVLTIIYTLKGNIILCTNVSDLAIGVVLMQDTKTIVYESCKLNYIKLYYLAYK